MDLDYFEIKERRTEGKLAGFAVGVPFLLRNEFKKSFPSAKKYNDLGVWLVGPRSGKRLKAWAAAELLKADEREGHKINDNFDEAKKVAAGLLNEYAGQAKACETSVNELLESAYFDTVERLGALIGEEAGDIEALNYREIEASITTPEGKRLYKSYQRRRRDFLAMRAAQRSFAEAGARSPFDSFFWGSGEEIAMIEGDLMERYREEANERGVSISGLLDDKFRELMRKIAAGETVPGVSFEALQLDRANLWAITQGRESPLTKTPKPSPLEPNIKGMTSGAAVHLLAHSIGVKMERVKETDSLVNTALYSRHIKGAKAPRPADFSIMGEFEGQLAACHFWEGEGYIKGGAGFVYGVFYCLNGTPAAFKAPKDWHPALIG